MPESARTFLNRRTPAALTMLSVLLLLPPVARPARAQDAPVTVTGIRLTRGDAVECPLIRDDAGRIHAVSHLSADIPVGRRVTVRGHTAVSTRCIGPVIAVETQTGAEDTTAEP